MKFIQVLYVGDSVEEAVPDQALGWGEAGKSSGAVGFVSTGGAEMEGVRSPATTRVPGAAGEGACAGA